MDKSARTIYGLMNRVRWNPFDDGDEIGYLVWYYAEDGLYIIRDTRIDAFFFIEAGNAIEAGLILQERLMKHMEEMEE